MRKNLKNSTLRKHYKQQDILKREVREAKQLLKRSHKKIRSLMEVIEQKEYILQKFWDPEALQYYKGVLIYVRQFDSCYGKTNAHIGALGYDYKRSAEIYTNANDHDKMGCKFQDGNEPYLSHRKEHFLGSDFKVFKRLIEICKDWVVTGDPNFSCCGVCIVYASCSDPCDEYVKTIY